MMKKATSLLLTGVMILGMSTSAFAEEAKTVSILWPETDSTQVDVVDNYLKPALAENFPDVTFDFIPMTADSPVKTMSASGDLPEIFFTGGAELDAIVAVGDALDLAPYLGEGWAEEHYNDPAQIYDENGVVRWLIAGQNEYYSPVFYYNTALFEENGLEEPKSLDELVTVCQTLADKGITPITSDAWTLSYNLLDGILEGAAPDALADLEEGKCDWTDERIVNALKYFDQLKTMGAFAADLVSKDGATSLAEFQSGKTAMWLTYSWCNYDVTEENLGFVPGTFNWPAAEGAEYEQLMFSPRKGYGCGYTANANAEDPQLLADILKVIVDAESTRHAANGLGVNYKVEAPAAPTHPLEIERMEEYNAAASRRSVMCQTSMDGVALAEFQTMMGMLLSDDAGYLSENFIEEFNPVWEMNTYVAH